MKYTMSKRNLPAGKKEEKKGKGEKQDTSETWNNILIKGWSDCAF